MVQVPKALNRFGTRAFLRWGSGIPSGGLRRPGWHADPFTTSPQFYATTAPSTCDHASRPVFGSGATVSSARVRWRQRDPLADRETARDSVRWRLARGDGGFAPRAVAADHSLRGA